MDPILDNRIMDIILKFDPNQTSWVLKNHYVESIAQCGPQCGIVALCMALNYLKIECSVQDLMKKAAELNFSKSGEIFNIDYLFELATSYHGVKCKVIQIQNQEQELELFESLLNSKLVLIAYDCDLNYEPCFKKGLKAHWALLTGLLLPIDTNMIEHFKLTDLPPIESNLVKLDKNSISDNQINNLRSLYSGNHSIDNQIDFKKSIFALCKQGKSKYYGVWNLSKLIESNRQLKEIDHVKCNDEEFIKPSDGDLQKTLASKVLVFN